MTKIDIKDSFGGCVGYAQEDNYEIKYFGFTKGYVGRYDKTSKRWFWMSGPKMYQLGPNGDIGYSEVLRAEGKL